MFLLLHSTAYVRLPCTLPKDVGYLRASSCRFPISRHRRRILLFLCSSALVRLRTLQLPSLLLCFFSPMNNSHFFLRQNLEMFHLGPKCTEPRTFQRDGTFESLTTISRRMHGQQCLALNEDSMKGSRWDAHGMHMLASTI